jgi:hypothetical protein
MLKKCRKCRFDKFLNFEQFKIPLINKSDLINNTMEGNNLSENFDQSKRYLRLTQEQKNMLYSELNKNAYPNQEQFEEISNKHNIEKNRMVQKK